MVQALISDQLSLKLWVVAYGRINCIFNDQQRSYKTKQKDKNKILHRFYYYIFHFNSQFSLSFPHSRKTVSLSELIMSADKHPSILILRDKPTFTFLQISLQAMALGKINETSALLVFEFGTRHLG